MDCDDIAFSFNNSIIVDKSLEGHLLVELVSLIITMGIPFLSMNFNKHVTE